LPAARRATSWATPSDELTRSASFAAARAPARSPRPSRATPIQLHAAPARTIDVGGERREDLLGLRVRLATQELPRDEHQDLRGVAEAGARAADDVVGLALEVEAEEALCQAEVAGGDVALDLREAEELLARVIEGAPLEQAAGEIDAGRHESGVDLERLAVVLLSLLPLPSAVGQQAERVVRRGHVGVEVLRLREVLPRLLDVAAPELDVPEVHPGLRETRAVFDGKREPRLGGRQVSGRERRCAITVQLQCFWRKRGHGRARTGEQGERDHQEQERPHGHPVGPSSPRLREIWIGFSPSGGR